jgi:signal transduction histidine kinase
MRRRRIRSLRARLLIAMVLPALIAIGVAFLLYLEVEQRIERADDQRTTQAIAQNIARLSDATQRQPDAATLQAALPDYQVSIVLDGRPVVTTPLPPRGRTVAPEFTATAAFLRGTVTVRAYPADPAIPWELLVVGVAPALLLVVSAVSATGYLSRELRRQIDHASQAAERVAAGDLSARMGAAAQGEFRPLARAFDGMATRLDTSDRNQRQFLGDLAHELATPVTAISGSGLALAEGAVMSDEERLEAAQTLTRETRRLQELLADLRRLTRIDLAQAVNPGPVSIAQVCRDVCERYSPIARAAGLQLTLRDADVDAVSDRRLIEMIVGNLVANAIAYTPSGGTVRIDVRRQRGDVVIAVRDTGIGIAAEHRERIFDRFYRVDEARQRATGGSGLGLSIAMRAANELHGRIELVSEPGTGSLFRLIFPARISAELDTAPVAVDPVTTRGEGA